MTTLHIVIVVAVVAGLGIALICLRPDKRDGPVPPILSEPPKAPPPPPPPAVPEVEVDVDVDVTVKKTP